MENENSYPQKGEIHIQIGNVQAQGNIAIGGDRAEIRAQTGDLIQSNQRVMCGGITTTRADVEKLTEKLDIVEAEIDEETAMDAAKREIVEHAVAYLHDQLTGNKRVNEPKITKAIQYLARLGPRTAKSLCGLLAEPLAQKILCDTGPTALQFCQKMLSRFALR